MTNVVDDGFVYGDGQLSVFTTEDEWKKILEQLRKLARVHKKELMISSSERQSEYSGQTQYEIYSKYIKDVLQEIRIGHTDYCYFLYQLQDLLSFEPDVQVNWVRDGNYFEVSLPVRL